MTLRIKRLLLIPHIPGYSRQQLTDRLKHNLDINFDINTASSKVSIFQEGGRPLRAFRPTPYIKFKLSS